jgi:hypothetical protein
LKMPCCCRVAECLNRHRRSAATHRTPPRHNSSYHQTPRSRARGRARCHAPPKTRFGADLPIVVTRLFAFGCLDQGFDARPRINSEPVKDP